MAEKRVLFCYMSGDFVEEIKDFMAHLAIGCEGKNSQLGVRESFNGFPIFVIFECSDITDGISL